MVPSKKWRCQKVGAPKRIWQCLKLERHSPCPNALTRCLKIKRPLPFAASRTKRFWQFLKLERHLPSANVLRQHSPLDALPCEPGSVAAKGLPSVPDVFLYMRIREEARQRRDRGESCWYPDDGYGSLMSQLKLCNVRRSDDETSKVVQINRYMGICAFPSHPCAKRCHKCRGLMPDIDTQCHTSRGRNGFDRHQIFQL